MPQNPNEPNGGYVDLKARISKRLRNNKSEEVLELVRASYKQILHDEPLVLSRAENERLFKQVAKELFEELIKNL